MVQTAGQRRVARITIPWQLYTKASLQVGLVRLVDLSSLGARIEHPDPVHEEIACFLELPPALGEAHLVCRIVWTRLYEGERGLDGGTHVSYQSGLAFVGITPEQQTALASALEILKTEHDRPEHVPSH